MFVGGVVYQDREPKVVKEIIEGVCWGCGLPRQGWRGETLAATRGRDLLSLAAWVVVCTHPPEQLEIETDDREGRGEMVRGKEEGR